MRSGPVMVRSLAEAGLTEVSDQTGIDVAEPG
jgi:hypothetical protein